MENGFIKLYRQIQNWEWYTDSETVHFFIHCIFSANWKDKKWQGQEIKRGQFVTSYANLSAQTGISVKQIRLRIERLVSTGELKVETTNRFTIVTVCKYDTYQSKYVEEGKQKAIKGQSKDKQRATTEEDKESKEVKINYVQFVDLWNNVNDCNLRITDSKREQIRSRLRTYSEDELKQSIRNRAKDDWINGEGKKYKTNWDSFWRNDEKPERYLNVETTNKVMDGGLWNE